MQNRCAAVRLLALVAVATLIDILQLPSALDSPAAAEPQAARVEITPRVAELIAALERPEDAIDALQVDYICLSKHQFVKRGEKLPDNVLIEDGAVAMIRRADVSWEMTRDGRARMECAVERTNIGSDGAQSTHNEDVISVFDGNSGVYYSQHTAHDGSIVRSGHATKNLMRTHDSPFALTMWQQQTPITDVLRANRATLLRDEDWEGRSVAVVEVEPLAIRDDFILRRQFWIDEQRGVVVRRESHVQRGADKPWALHLRIDATKFAEEAPGVWLPRGVESWNYVVTETGQGFLASHDKYAIAKWTINPTISPSRFKRDVPLGTSVVRPGAKEPQEILR